MNPKEKFQIMCSKLESQSDTEKLSTLKEILAEPELAQLLSEVVDPNKQLYKKPLGLKGFGAGTINKIRPDTIQKLKIMYPTVIKENEAFEITYDNVDKPNKWAFQPYPHGIRVLIELQKHQVVIRCSDTLCILMPNSKLKHNMQTSFPHQEIILDGYISHEDIEELKMHQELIISKFMSYFPPAIKLPNGEIKHGRKGQYHSIFYDELLSKQANIDFKDAEEGFINEKGNFLSKNQAKDEIGLKQDKLVGKLKFFVVDYVDPLKTFANRQNFLKSQKFEENLSFLPALPITDLRAHMIFLKKQGYKKMILRNNESLYQFEKTRDMLILMFKE
jgi:hypothetical protein